ncbi:MAG: FAD-dependent oxidoreductase [Devosia sp.]
MSRQPNRLAAADTHKFSGADIDRSKPLGFRLNGRQIEGFAGDTVLSAALASGIETVGLRAGEPIGLSERFAPAVMPVDSTGDPTTALPMERMPALPGLNLVTLGSLRERIAAVGPLAKLRHWLLGPGRTLNLRLDDPGTVGGAWRDLQPQATLETDTLVIGGGIAGMTAAATAAAAGDMVVLIERRPALGGDARFFGTLENEEAPDAAITRLSRQLVQMQSVTLLTHTEAFGLSGTTVRAHQIEVHDGRAVARALAIKAKRVVLATGALERLPVFPGNRSPGVGGAVAAFHRADRYGVWLGKHTLFNTPHNFGYRLALLAKDAGVQVERITDARVNPQSRFIDFCKASGITLAGGLVPKAALPAKSSLGGVSVRFAVAIEDISQETAPIHADQFIAAGGWQPELSLWLMAGGRCGWNARAGWLEGQGKLEGVVLAGSAAGFRNSSACMQSGRSVIGELLGRPPAPIDDRQIEAIYESPDGPTPANPRREAGKSRAFLGSGFGFAARAMPASRRDPVSVVAAHPRTLELEDVAAAVQVGDIPQSEAGIVAAERCLGPGVIANGGWCMPSPPGETQVASTPPAYLAGRFGPKPRLSIVGVGDTRFFEPGCLIFLGSDETDPAKAVGVIIGPAPGGRSGGLAMIGKAPGGAGAKLFVRDTSGPVQVELLERLKAAPSA